MDNWENNDFEVTMPTPVVTDKWEGEDEDDDVKDSWDDPEEEKKEEEKPQQQAANTTKKTKKQLEKKIEEKERKLRESVTKKPSEMTPEELSAEKIRRKELQEQADLMLARQLLGADTQSLDTQEEFDKFKDDILSKLEDSTKKEYFPTFVELLLQGLCVHLPSADLKKLSAWLSNLHIEKSKLEKGDKAKKNKGKGKAKLKLEGDTAYNEFSAYTEEDYDEFM